jgi:hypothetical protein
MFAMAAGPRGVVKRARERIPLRVGVERSITRVFKEAPYKAITQMLGGLAGWRRRNSKSMPTLRHATAGGN